MHPDGFHPLSEEEVARRLARANEELIQSDIPRFARRHQCVMPTPIVDLYQNHELLTQRHYMTQCGVVVRWFCPINDATFIHTAENGNRYAIFACVGDGESFCFPVGNDPDDCQIQVLWDSGEMDRIDLTANTLKTAPNSNVN